jgi:hypothetical protein
MQNLTNPSVLLRVKMTIIVANTRIEFGVDIHTGFRIMTIEITH